MANDFFGNIVADSKKISIPINLRRNPGGVELTNILASEITATYWRNNSSPMPINVIDLASLNDPHTPGGWFPVDNNYRFDIPDAAFANGANWVVISVSSTNSFVFNERYNIEAKSFLQVQGSSFDNNLTNSYMTVTGADDYFDTKFNNAVWDSVDANAKQRALIEATRLIDTLNYRGQKTNSTQYLEFPRNSETIIPENIKVACCEIAFEIINGFDGNLELNNLQVMSHGYGSSKTQYTREFVLEHLSHGIPSSFAWRLLRPYLRDPNRLIVSGAVI